VQVQIRVVKHRGSIMTDTLEITLHVIFIGVGATIVMDTWLLFLRWRGISTLNYAFLGRWIGHLPRGRWTHDRIAAAAPIPGEMWIGWSAHYAIGIGFAALLVSLCGLEWVRSPALLPALIVGGATVVAPLFILQPALGAGIASSRTPTPLRNCFKSVIHSHLLWCWPLPRRSRNRFPHPARALTCRRNAQNAPRGAK
jgi:hypothetical protein